MSGFAAAQAFDDPNGANFIKLKNRESHQEIAADSIDPNFNKLGTRPLSFVQNLYSRLKTSIGYY